MGEQLELIPHDEPDEKLKTEARHVLEQSPLWDELSDDEKESEVKDAAYRLMKKRKHEAEPKKEA